MSEQAKLFQVGDQVLFSYRQQDWDWLQRSNGPMGPYVAKSKLPAADGQMATVMSTEQKSPYFSGWVQLRFQRPLGFSSQQEYDAQQLKEQGWDIEEWPTDFAAPPEALNFA